MAKKPVVKEFDQDKAALMVLRATEMAENVGRFIEDCKTMIGENSSEIGDLCEAFVLVRSCAETVHNATKEINKYKDFLSYTTIPEAMMSANVKNVTTGSGFRVTLLPQLSVTMKDKEAGYDWLREHGHEALIQETVNSSALKAAVKNMMETENIEPPTDIFDVKVYTSTSVTAPKKSK